MDLKKLSSFGKDLFSRGKEILGEKLQGSRRIQAPPLKKNNQQKSETSNDLARKFEVPPPHNEAEAARQQSMLDSQGLPNQTEAYGLGNSREGTNSNMGQRNFNNHQQN